jgi:cytochrome c556
MKKKLIAMTAIAALAAFGVMAQTAKDPFAEAVEMRHGLMLQMATDLGVLGGIAKGTTLYDAAIATKAAANVAAVASVISMAQFPAGSEAGKTADSSALADIWAKQDDFLAKIVDLNTAADAMKAAAGKDAASIGAAMAQLGGACGSCHKAYRQPEA